MIGNIIGKGKITLKRFLRSPVLVLLLVLIILRMVTNPSISIGEWFMDKILILPGIIIGLSFHEFAHGAVSNALGDPTPKQQGRLTVNPAAHIDPFGFICLLLAGFGWGIPVEINPGYYKKRRLGEILVSLAGVAMNFLIAIVFALIMKGLLVWQPAFVLSDLGEIVFDILSGVVSINVILMIFNLLPVPPLDGFSIVTEIFNLRRYSWYYEVYDKGFLILLALIIFNVTDFVLLPCVSFMLQWIYSVFVF